MKDSFYQTLAKKPIGVGVLLFDKKGRLLVVKPNYKDCWSLPGGIVNKKESPRDGLIREIKEEISLGLDKQTLRFLCLDYVLGEERKESLQFIFTREALRPSEISRIVIRSAEINDYKFLAVDEALLLLSKPSQQRIPRCLEAIKNHRALLYLENGKEV
jgi:ADP-ribose pyrophosphatase YjhB (NUDIX family)